MKLTAALAIGGKFTEGGPGPVVKDGQVLESSTPASPATISIDIGHTSRPEPPSWEECLAALTAVLGAPAGAHLKVHRVVRSLVLGEVLTEVRRRALWWRLSTSFGCVALSEGDVRCTLRAETWRSAGGGTAASWRHWGLDPHMDDAGRSNARGAGITYAAPDEAARQALAFMGWAS